MIILLSTVLCLQEQSNNDSSDMQLMRAHTETLLDTLRDIAQVNMMHIWPCLHTVGMEVHRAFDFFLFLS